MNTPENSCLESQNAYTHKKYDFLLWSVYDEVRELLWDIQLSDIIWEWQNAIVVNSPHDKSKVLKIAKTWKVDDLLQERKNHYLFYEALQEVKDQVAHWIQQWQIHPDDYISDRISIPKLWDEQLANWVYFEMEKVFGQSFRSLFYRTKYKNELLEKYSHETLVRLSDREMEAIVWDLWLQHIPAILFPSDYMWNLIYKESQRFMNDQFSSWEYNSELGSAMWYLQQYWFEHIDRHTWNFMKTPVDKNYIIDFWSVCIHEK